jgi:hypothetical protein
MCWADIHNMSATDKNVCRLSGGANRHESRHCQPRRLVNYSFYTQFFLIRINLAFIYFLYNSKVMSIEEHFPLLWLDGEA